MATEPPPPPADGRDLLPGPRRFAAPETPIPPGGDEPGRRRRLVIALVLLGAFLVAAAVTLILLMTRNNRTVAQQTQGPTVAAATFSPTAAASATATATLSPSAPAAATAPASGAVTGSNPLAATAVLFPFRGPACGSASGNYGQACPVSPRLAARLSELYAQQGQSGFEPLCRCNPPAWSHVDYQALNANQVKVTFTFGSRTAPMTMTFTQVAEGWVADDSVCTATSIYDKQPLPCFNGG